MWVGFLDRKVLDWEVLRGNETEALEEKVGWIAEEAAGNVVRRAVKWWVVAAVGVAGWGFVWKELSF